LLFQPGKINNRHYRSNRSKKIEFCIERIKFTTSELKTKFYLIQADEM